MVLVGASPGFIKDAIESRIAGMLVWQQVDHGLTKFPASTNAGQG